MKALACWLTGVPAAVMLATECVIAYDPDAYVRAGNSDPAGTIRAVRQVGLSFFCLAVMCFYA
ncbi:MAG TPA: hypothetical protein VH374_26385 [Polyangia bacterium]|nr:hypothetical protein [Polyangia bacterium]